MIEFKWVSSSVWDDDNFIGLPSIEPSGQILWIYLLTSEKTASLIPGLTCTEKSDMAAHLHWKEKSFNKCFKEILKQKMAQYDEETRVLWLPNAIRYNPPESPEELEQWAEYADSIPDCEVKTRAIYRIYQEMCKIDKQQNIPAFVPAFNQFFASKRAREIPALSVAN